MEERASAQLCLGRGEERREFAACLSTLEAAGEGQGLPPRTGFLQGCWPPAPTLFYQVLPTTAARIPGTDLLCGRAKAADKAPQLEAGELLSAREEKESPGQGEAFRHCWISRCPLRWPCTFQTRTHVDTTQLPRTGKTAVLICLP